MYWAAVLQVGKMPTSGLTGRSSFLGMEQHFRITLGWLFKMSRICTSKRVLSILVSLVGEEGAGVDDGPGIGSMISLSSERTFSDFECSIVGVAWVPGFSTGPLVLLRTHVPRDNRAFSTLLSSKLSSPIIVDVDGMSTGSLNPKIS